MLNFNNSLGPLVRGILTLATLDQREASPMRQSTSQQSAPPRCTTLSFIASSCMNEF